METVKFRHRLAFFLSMTVITVAAFIGVIAGWLAFVPVNVVAPRTQPYKVATPVIKAGDNLIYVADVCKYKDLFSTTTRTFVDQEGVHYPLIAQISNVPKGCNSNPVVVPTLLSFHPGVWYLTIDTEYQVNVLRSESYHFRTVTFTITAGQGVQ